MLVVFYSETGNVATFVEKTGLETFEVVTGDETIDQPFVVVTPTTGDGEAPYELTLFLDEHKDHIRGVAASGDLAWGDSYGAAAKVIAEEYDVPVLHIFELEGTDEDVTTFVDAVKAL